MEIVAFFVPVKYPTMRKILFIAMMGLQYSFAFAQQTVPLSLEEAIDYAIKNQPAFQNYKVDRDIASARKFESVTKYLPKVNGSFDLRDNLRLGEIALKIPNPQTGEEQQLRIQQGTKYVGTGGFELNQPIVDASALVDMNTSKQQQQLSQLQLEAAVIDLKISVTRAYYLVLVNRERMEKAKKAVERNQKFYDDAKVRFDNETALKTEVSRAYLNLSNSKFQYKIAEDSVKTSQMNLAKTIGLPLQTEVTITSNLPHVLTVESLPEFADSKSVADNRVEMKAERMQQSINRMQLKKIDYQYIPTLSGYGFIGGQGLDNEKLFQRSSWYWNSYIGVRLQVPIFDGLYKMSLSQQQRLALVKNRNNMENLTQNIGYQLQTSSINYLNSASNLKLIKENLALAEDVLKEVKVRYENSFATYQEVIDAENTLKETEFNFLQALYAFLMSELEWKKANGRL